MPGHREICKVTGIVQTHYVHSIRVSLVFQQFGANIQGAVLNHQLRSLGPSADNTLRPASTTGGGMSILAGVVLCPCEPILACLQASSEACLVQSLPQDLHLGGKALYISGSPKTDQVPPALRRACSSA